MQNMIEWREVGCLWLVLNVLGFLLLHTVDGTLGAPKCTGLNVTQKPDGTCHWSLDTDNVLFSERNNSHSRVTNCRISLTMAWAGQNDIILKVGVNGPSYRLEGLNAETEVILDMFLKEGEILTFETVRSPSTGLEVQNVTVSESKIDFMRNPILDGIILRRIRGGPNMSDLNVLPLKFGVYVLHCKGNSCPATLKEAFSGNVSGFQQGYKSPNSSAFVINSFGNETATIPINDAYWELYNMTTADSFDISSHCNFTAFMKNFSITRDNCFSPCYLFPVLPLVNCDQSGALLELSLSGMGVDVELLKTLPTVPDLTKLVLSNNSLQGNLSAALQKFPKLEYLDLSFNELVGFDHFDPGLKMTLNFLNLAHNSLGDGSGFVMEGLSRLKELSLLSNKNLRGDFNRTFLGLNHTKLDVRCNNFTGEIPREMQHTTWYFPGNELLRPQPAPSNAMSGPAPFQELNMLVCDPPPTPSSSASRKKAVVLVAAVVGALLFGCGTFGIFFLLVSRKSSKEAHSLARSSSSHEGTGFLRRQKLHDAGCLREFSVSEIECATDSTTTALLGKGSFGDVFAATLDGTGVVIKFRAKGTTSILQDFRRDVAKLSSLCHKNLVKLIGFCDGKEYQALVVEYFPNGSLEYHLHGNRSLPPLDWRTRLNILIGAASAIEHLHLHSESSYLQMRGSGPMIHCDVKSSNILLDDQFDARVSDFGFFKPKLFGDKQHSDLRCFAGYLDPEYLTNEQKVELDRKSDVYSLGVVLLETVSGRPPIHTLASQNGPLRITEWAARLRGSGDINGILDPRMPIDHSFSIDVARAVIDIALQCVDENASLRPTIRTVRRGLDDAYKMEFKSVIASSTGSINMEIPAPSDASKVK